MNVTDSNTQPTKLSKAQRHIRRRVLLWLLYAMDVTRAPDAVAMTVLSQPLLSEFGQQMPESFWGQVMEDLRQIWSTQKDLDARIQQLSPRWKVERMATIDRNVLRLGTWEIMEQTDRPVVVLNDCIDLAKQFGGKGSGAFINGLLDQLCKDLKLNMR